MPDLSESQTGDQRFRLAVEAAPAAMVMIDREGRIILVNAETETMFGYAREELLGQSVEILLPEAIRKRHSVLRDGFFANLKTRHMASSHDLVALRKDGSQFPVQIGLNPIDGPDGPWVLSSIVDIGERKRSEEQFRLAVEAGSSAMVLVDQEGQIVLLNSHAAALFGYEQEELIGRKVEILLPDPYKQSHPEFHEGLLPRAPLGPVARGRDLHARRKDGSRFPAEVVLNPMETGKATWVLVCIVDLTLQSRKLESLGALASGIAHDFNNLLSVVLSMTELVSSALPIEQPVQADLQRITEATEQAANLANQLLTFSKQHRVASRRIEINRVASRTLELLRASLPARIELKVELAAQDLFILADETQIQQVLMNLCLNGRDAMPDGGLLHVQTTLIPGASAWVRLSVRDHGTGITEQAKAHLFDPFFSTKEHGTGLGLAVVHQIVESQGGRIEVSTEPGRGACFEVSWPVSNNSPLE
jgi:PAS domain S-box-containing protein